MKKKLSTLIRDTERVEALAKIKRRINLLSKRARTKKYERPVHLQKLEKELEGLVNEFIKEVQEVEGHEVH